MKPLLALLCPVAYNIWLACYVGVSLLPDGWAAEPNTPWWTFPVISTFGVLGFLSIWPLLLLTGTGSDNHDDFYP
jgi:hypothetical protein